MRHVGAEWVGCCPLPDHEDRSPSFCVNPEKNLWYCHGCLRGGDVVELARLAWAYEKHEAKMVAADLLHTFGHEIPPRPASWYAKQERQRLVRDALEEACIGHYQRRLFRRFVPVIETIEDEAERREEIERAWDACEEIACIALAGRTETR